MFQRCLLCQHGFESTKNNKNIKTEIFFFSVSIFPCPRRRTNRFDFVFFFLFSCLSFQTWSVRSHLSNWIEFSRKRSEASAEQSNWEKQDKTTLQILTSKDGWKTTRQKKTFPSSFLASFSLSSLATNFTLWDQCSLSSAWIKC